MVREVIYARPQRGSPSGRICEAAVPAARLLNTSSMRNTSSMTRRHDLVVGHVIYAVPKHSIHPGRREAASLG
jgi:hypothetical protein